jgi:hemerythrin-like metal-binding protein
LKGGPIPVFEWIAAYSVNVKRCDDDHQRLFELIRELRSAILRGKSAEVMDKIVEELEDYSVFHFTAEEALLEAANYPLLEAHRTEHRKFIDRLAKFRREGIAGQPYEVLNFMNRWLVHHIKTIDKQYSDYLNATGVF